MAGVEEKTKTTEKTKPKFRRKNLDIWFVSISALILLSSFIIDFFNIRLPEIMINTISTDQQESMFISLFSVQASMATLSIAIISILNSIISENFYAISAGRYVTELRPKFLTHKRIICANILITCVNYFVLSQSMFNVTIAIFCISMGFNLILVTDTYTIFGGINRIKKEIREYALQQYNSEYLDDLGKEISAAISESNFKVFEQDNELIKDIFRKECSFKNGAREDITNQIRNIISDEYEQSVYTHNPNWIKKIDEICVDFFEIANENNLTDFTFALWNGIQNLFFKSVNEIPAPFLNESDLCKNLRKQLYNIPTDKQRSANLKYFTVWIFSVFSNTKKLNADEDVQILKERLYSNVMWELITLKREATNTYKENGLTTIALECCLLHKHMIDLSDYKILRNEFFPHGRFQKSNIQFGAVYLITLLYLYYLSYREDLVIGKKIQTGSQQFIEGNGNNIKSFYYGVDIKEVLAKYGTQLHDIAMEWEYMENMQCKLMQMETVYQDFMVFSLLLYDTLQFRDNVSLAVQGSFFPIYNRYFSSTDDSTLKNEFIRFKKLFSKDRNLSDASIRNELGILKDAISFNYKKEYIDSVIKTAISKDDAYSFCEKASEKLKEDLQHIFSVFDHPDISNQKNKKYKKDLKIFTITTPPPFDDELLSYISESVINRCSIMIIMSAIADNNILKYKYGDKEKQTKLLSEVEKMGLTPNVVMGQYSSFWGEADPELINNYTEAMHRIEFHGGYNSLALLDSSSVDFKFTNLNVEIVELSDKEVLKYCETDEDGNITYDENGNIQYNVTNAIYLPFTTDEVMNYGKKHWKKIVVKLDYEYSLSDKPVGVAMIVDFDNS